VKDLGSVRSKLVNALKKSGAVAGTAAIGLAGAGCFCVDPLPEPSDMGVPNPDSSPVDAATDGGINIDAGTDSGFIADPLPPPMDSGMDAGDGSASYIPGLEGDGERSLHPSFRVRLHLKEVRDDGSLVVETTGRHIDDDTRYVWKVTGGNVEADSNGALARVKRPADGSPMLVQVIASTRRGEVAVDAIEIGG